MYFIGDVKNPRRFSRFVRLCLYVGIKVVFIAPSSPWMNGSIENFNNWFGSKFWDKDTFADLEDIRTDHRILLINITISVPGRRETKD